MKRFIAASVGLAVGTGALAQAGTRDMVITRAGSQAASKGPARNFTGSVRVDPAWHTHPAGQVLVVTAGIGRIRQRGGMVEEIRAGDVVWTPPGVKHWHGAGPAVAMTRMAIQNVVDGKNVVWLEKVSDAQYGK